MKHVEAMLVLMLLTISAGAAALPTLYDCYDWTGDAGDHRIQTAGNWSGDVAPYVQNATETENGHRPCLIFPEGAGIVSNTTADFQIGRLVFKGTSPITFDGQRPNLVGNSRFWTNDCPVVFATDFRASTWSMGKFIVGNTIDFMKSFTLSGGYYCSWTFKRSVPGGIHFHGPFNIATDTMSYANNGLRFSPEASTPIHFHDAVNVRSNTVFESTSGQGANLHFHGPINGISLRVQSYRFNLESDNVLSPTGRIDWAGARAYGIVDMKGHSQVAGSLDGTYLDGAVPPAANERVITSEQPATLIVKCSPSAATPVSVQGKVDLVIDARAADGVQTFEYRDNTTEGSVVISNGTLRLAKGARFSHVRRLFLCANGKLEVDAENGVDSPFPALTTLTVEPGATITLGSGAFPAGVVAKTPMHQGREMVWSDDFDGHDIDRRKWEFKRLSNVSDHMYANDPSTCMISNGVLRLRIQKSGDPDKPFVRPECLTTMNEMNYRYGYLEMRARLPFSRGSWPAFWLQSPARGRTVETMAEVDIFESFSSSNSLQSAIHKWTAADHCSQGWRNGLGAPYVYRDCSHLQEEFHVYGYEWTPQMVRFYVDGTCYQSFYIDDAHDFTTTDGKLAGMQCFHDPEAVIISMSMFTPAGPMYTPETALRPEDVPVEYDIDWVRLWQKPDSEERITYDLSKGGVVVDEALYVGAGTMTLLENMIHDVGTVALTNSASVLEITVPANLKGAPAMTLVTGAKVKIAAGVVLNVSTLAVDGVALPAGDYNAVSLPGSIAGEGTLRVGPVASHAPQRLVWTGGAGDALWSSAANWNPPYVPGAGDTAVFDSSVALAAGHALIDDGALTIEANANVTNRTSFSGVGALVKTGSGSLAASAQSHHKGGVTIARGVVGIHADDALGDPCGDVVLDYSQWTSVRLDGKVWNPNFRNPVVIRGPTGTDSAIRGGNKFDIMNLVTADCDFTTASTYGPLSYKGGVSAHGHTMTYNGAGFYRDDESCLSGSFDVALTVKGAYSRILGCQGVGVDHALQLIAGTNYLSSSFTWEGTNVVISGSRTLVTARGENNFSSHAALHVSDGAQLSIAEGVRLHVRRLVVDGVRQPHGLYCADSVPSRASAGVIDRFPGYGVLFVVETGTKVIIH